MDRTPINNALFERALNGLVDFYNTYQDYLNIALTFIAVTLVIILIINIGKLTTAGDNPIKRQEAINGIMISGICLGVLGSFGLILGIVIYFLFM